MSESPEGLQKREAIERTVERVVSNFLSRQFQKWDGLPSAYAAFTVVLPKAGSRPGNLLRPLWYLKLELQ